MNARTITLCKMSIPPESNSALRSRLDCDVNRRYEWIRSDQSSWKRSLFNLSSAIWEHNVRVYCRSYAQLNIILLNWNEQHPESGIIKWGCRLLNKNFHLVLMITGFGSMQIWIGLNIEPSGFHFGTNLTSTYLQSRHLHAVERQTRIMVFWTSFPLVPPQFGDWHHLLDRYHISELLDHRTW